MKTQILTTLLLGLTFATLAQRRSTAWHDLIPQPEGLQTFITACATADGALVTVAPTIVQGGGNGGALVMIKTDTGGVQRWRRRLSFAPGDTLAFTTVANYAVAAQADGRLLVVASVVSTRPNGGYSRLFLQVDGATGAVLSQTLVPDLAAGALFLHPDRTTNGWVLAVQQGFSSAIMRFTRGNLLANVKGLGLNGAGLYELHSLVPARRGWLLSGAADNVALPSRNQSVLLVDHDFEPIRGAQIALKTNWSRGRGAAEMAGGYVALVHDSIHAPGTPQALYRPMVTGLDSSFNWRWSGRTRDSNRISGGPTDYADYPTGAFASLPSGKVMLACIFGATTVDTAGRFAYYSPWLGAMNYYNYGNYLTQIPVTPQGVPYVYGQPSYQMQFPLSQYGVAWTRASPQDITNRCTTERPNPGLLPATYQVVPASPSASPFSIATRPAPVLLNVEQITCRIPICGEKPRITAMGTCRVPAAVRVERLFEGQRQRWDNGDTAASTRLTTEGMHYIDISTPCFTYRDSVLIQNFPQIALAADTPRICSGDTIRLRPVEPGFDDLAWRDDAGGQTGTSFYKRFTFVNNTGQVQYRQVYVTGTYNLACTSTDSQTVAVAPRTPKALPDSILLCNGADTLLLAQSWYPLGQGFAWRLPSGERRDLPFNAAAAGLYRLTFQQGGCAQADSLRLATASLPATLEIIASQNPTCADSVTIELRADVLPPGRLSWWQNGSTMPGQNGPAINARPGRSYQARFANACGQIESPALEITREDCEPALPYEVFNVVTSSADNAYFMVKNAPAVTAWALKITSRWGAEVFSGTYAEKAWPAGDTPAGVYFYRLDTDRGSFKGWVEVVR